METRIEKCPLKANLNLSSYWGSSRTHTVSLGRPCSWAPKGVYQHVFFPTSELNLSFKCKMCISRTLGGFVAVPGRLCVHKTKNELQRNINRTFSSVTFVMSSHYRGKPVISCRRASSLQLQKSKPLSRRHRE